LNKRIGVHEEKDFHQTFEDLLVASVVEKRMTLQQLFTEPELDSWKYLSPDDGPHAFSSSTFVAWIFKAAGIFDGLEINAQEFTVKDVYELDIFNTTSFKGSRPKTCQEADPHIPFCQLMGLYRINLPTLSTIKPYNRMNEKCPSHPPLYERPKDC